MKIGGVEVKGPAEEILVLPRPTAQDLVFRAVAVTDMSEFNSKCPPPTPQKRLVPGGQWKQALDDPQYLQAVQDHSRLQFCWMVLKSLEPSNIEWDTVEENSPSTWMNWESDLLNAGLSQTEVNHVSNCVASANALNQQKLDAARENFLRGLERASEKSSFPSTDQQSTPSGGPANDSESDPQE